MAPQHNTPEFYRRAGFNAYRLGITAFGCPFSGKSMEGKAWLAGYVEAKRSRPLRWVKA